MNRPTTSKLSSLILSALDDSYSPQAAINIAANMIPMNRMGVLNFATALPLFALWGFKIY